MNKYYTEINHKDSIFYDYFINNSPEYQKISEFKGDFMGTPIDRDIYLSDEFLSDLDKNFPIKVVGFLEMTPWTVYKWHKDIYRSASINLLLTAHDESYCLFTSEGDEALQIDVSELKYKEKTFYLFNTQERHMVLNLDKNRYLFSVEFEGTPPYAALVKWADSRGWTK